MKITHQLPDQPKVISEYNLEDHTLTRIIDSTIHIIHLKHKTGIADLARLSKLTNEDFSLMAYLQNKKD